MYFTFGIKIKTQSEEEEISGFFATELARAGAKQALVISDRDFC